MNKKTILALVIGAFVVGGASMIALESHAQTAQKPVAQIAQMVSQPDQKDSAASSTDTDSVNHEYQGQEHDSTANQNEVEDAQ